MSGDGGVARCPPPACNQGADGSMRATAGRDRKARANAYGACRKLTLLPPNLRLIRKPGQAELRLGGHCRKCRTSLAAPSSSDACGLSVWSKACLTLQVLASRFSSADYLCRAQILRVATSGLKSSLM